MRCYQGLLRTVLVKLKTIVWAVVVVQWSASSSSSPTIRVRILPSIKIIYDETGKNKQRRGRGWPIFNTKHDSPRASDGTNSPPHHEEPTTFRYQHFNTYQMPRLVQCRLLSTTEWDVQIIYVKEKSTGDLNIKLFYDSISVFD